MVVPQRSYNRLSSRRFCASREANSNNADILSGLSLTTFRLRWMRRRSFVAAESASSMSSSSPCREAISRSIAILWSQPKRIWSAMFLYEPGQRECISWGTKGSMQRIETHHWQLNTHDRRSRPAVPIPLFMLTGNPNRAHSLVEQLHCDLSTCTDVDARLKTVATEPDPCGVQSDRQVRTQRPK